MSGLSQDSYSKCQIIMTWHISALKPRPVEAMEMILAYCIERHAKGNQLDVSDKLVLKARDELIRNFALFHSLNFFNS